MNGQGLNGLKSGRNGRGLIKLYAEREATKGYAYPTSDTPWQIEFEEAFHTKRLRPLRAIADVS